jgi:hypothetical protein
MTWSRHSRRMEPITRSTYPFCHGERGAVRSWPMPMLPIVAWTAAKALSRSWRRNRGVCTSVPIGSTVVRLQTYLRPLPESLSAPGHHGNPRGEPIAVQRPRGPARLSALPRAGPTGAPSSRELGAGPPVKSVTRDARRLRVSVVRGEGPLLAPHRPHDPRQLVRHGHRSHIVAPSLFGAPRPRLEAARVRTRLRVPQHRSGAMNQQHAEVDVALLADGAEPPARSAGILLGRQAEETREVPALSQTGEYPQRGR